MANARKKSAQTPKSTAKTPETPVTGRKGSSKSKSGSRTKRK